MVSLYARQQSIQHILITLLGPSIEMIESGNHIILRRKNEPKPLFTGVVVNEKTKYAVSNAKISENNRSKTRTDRNGKFSVMLSEYPCFIRVSANGYRDTVFQVTETYKNVSVSLIPDSKVPEVLFKAPSLAPEQLGTGSGSSGDMKSAFEIRPLHDSMTYQSLEKKDFQISVLPFVGSDFAASRDYKYGTSLNLPCGYTGGVSGVEIGLLMNIVRQNVIGFQFGGLLNVVNGSVSGTQISIGSNLVFNNFSGIQAAGVYNYCRNEFNGVQFSLIHNRLSGASGGVQFSLISNLTEADFSGTQVSGVCTINRGNYVASQVALGANVTDGTCGVLQLSVFSNTADTVEGVQLALVNRCKKCHGVQVGLINVSEDNDGIAIGVLSVVKNGYRAVELSYSELNNVNFCFKSGLRKFYNIINTGISPQSGNWRMNLGYGIGSSVEFGKRWMGNCDLVINHVSEKNSFVKDLNLWLLLKPQIGVNIANTCVLFTGASLNLSISRFRNPYTNEFLTELSPEYSIFSKEHNNTKYSMWVGYSIGIRF